ncbi:MAG: DUF664 domain-containing protein [Flavobacteriaceae bacterium]|nr:DUF664 domain-containing protein [Flavobacteriaceae bacterium]
MKNYKLILPILAYLVLSTYAIHAQNKITPRDGYSVQIGTLVEMLEDLKSRITRSVRNLNQEQTDFLLDDNANTIGALIFHLAATEKYYQVYTFENRGYNSKEIKIWQTPMNLGEIARKELIDKPIDHYLTIWTNVRKETLRLLKTKDDAWLTKKTSRGSMNNHWAWYHVMEHQANHMGQIQMLRKRMPN